MFLLPIHRSSPLCSRSSEGLLVFSIFSFTDACLVLLLGLVSSVPVPRSVIGCEAFPWNDWYWVTWNAPWALVDVGASCRVDHHGQCRRSAPDIPLNADTHRRFTIYQHLAFHVEIYEINFTRTVRNGQSQKECEAVAAWSQVFKQTTIFFLSKSTNKSSAVAEMGDRLATIGRGRNWGGAAVGGWVSTRSQSNTMWPGPRPTTLPSGILIHPTVWPQL